jgi:hypothetical protein
MKVQKLLFVLGALLLLGSGAALAGGRVYGSVGVYLGGPGPYWGPGYARPYFYPRPYYPGPFYYPGPYYEPAPVVVVPPQPQVYIEQGEAAVEPEPEATQYWYYCRSAKNYYPYVKECPGGWQKVPSRPAQ